MGASAVCCDNNTIILLWHTEWYPQLLNHNLNAHCHCPPVESRLGMTEMKNWATMMTDKWYRKTGLFYVGLGLVFKLLYFLLLSFTCPLVICVGWFILILLPRPHVFWLGLFLFYFSLLSLFILGKVDFKFRIVSFPDKCWNSGQQVGNKWAMSRYTI